MKAERTTAFRPKDMLIALGLAAVAIAGAVEAVSTAHWSLRYGLFADRPPLSALQTALRFAIVLTATGLLVVRRDWLERIALVCAVIATGSSGLFGLGVRSPTLAAVRLIFHFLTYSIAVVWSLRLLRAITNRRSGEVQAAGRFGSGRT